MQEAWANSETYGATVNDNNYKAYNISVLLYRCGYAYEIDYTYLLVIILGYYVHVDLLMYALVS